MKLSEIFEPVLAPSSSFKGKPVKLPGIYDPKNRDIGLLGKTSAQTVIVKNTKTKQIVGKRTLFQKELSSKKAALPYNDPNYGPGG